MMQKIDTEEHSESGLRTMGVGRSVALRLKRLWLRFPMVVVLVVLLLSVTMQEWLGAWWLLSLTGAFCVSLLLYAALIRLQIRSHFVQFVCLTLAAGVISGKLHELNRSKSNEQLAQWQAFLDSRESSPTEYTGPWTPLACRCVIDSPIRYRKATQFRISEDPAQEGWQSLTVVRIEKLRVGKDWEPRSMLVPLTAEGRVRGLYPGDRIELFGQWRLPARPANPGQFDQAKRFAELGYAAQAKVESESQLQRKGTASVLRLDRYLAMLAASALTAMETHVILGQSELTAALVLGQREQAEWRLQEELLATGTIHMLSISGMHVEMVAMSLLLIGYLFQVPRKALLLATCLFVIGYAMLCGGNPPVARAALTLCGICIARWMGWKMSSMNLLACSGIILVLYRPSVIFETGTQLSFLAVAVLILSAKNFPGRINPLHRLIDSKSNRFHQSVSRLRKWSFEMLRTSFWVWFITAPIVWHSFHVICPIAILLNLILWLPMLFALMAGLGLILFGSITILAWPLGWVCGASLWCVEAIVGQAEGIPYGHFWLRSPPIWWMYGFYAIGIFASLLVGYHKPHSKRMLLKLLALWSVLGIALRPAEDLVRSILEGQDIGLSVTFLDVGHGTCALIETPDHETWLYDAGRLGDHQRSYQVITDALWAMNRKRLDGVLISHADSDHYNAVEGIARRFSIRQLISTKQVYEHPSPLLQRNITAATSRGSRKTIWKQGDYLDGHPWSMISVHPPSHDFQASDNAKSLCVLLEFAGRKIFLPGDLEPPGTSMLTALPAVDVDVLMAPHHGSLSSRSDRLLKWCSPETVVISGSYRALSPRVLESYDSAQAFVTARDHAVRLEITGSGDIKYLQWLVDHWVPIAL